MLVQIPVNIPAGNTCKFSNGEPCRLFHWGYEDMPFCMGWPEEKTLFITDFKKHERCLMFNFQKITKLIEK